MTRKPWMILLGIVALGLFAQYVLSQSCTPGYSAGSATIGDIQTSCVEQYPAPQTRTDVGIGEQVTCYISEGSWQGTAIYTDQYCNQYSVADGLGSITWSVIGDGTVYPTTGYETTLTVGLADADGVVTVVAKATDMLGVDAPVVKQKAMNEKIPTGLNPIGYNDQPPYELGTDLIGCRTDFIIQVIPQSVNFNDISLRENIAKYTWTWPNGDPGEIDAKIVGPTKPKTQQVGKTTIPNIIGDTVAAFGASLTVDLLKDKTKCNQFVDFDKPSPTVPVEYLDENGKWQNFDNKGTRPIHWTGLTQKGRAGVIAAGTLWGTDQGPFKKQD